MSQEQVNISHMQCWLFRLAQAKWKKNPQDTASLFRRFNLFDFIAECYDDLHLSSYHHALDLIEELLSRNGVRVC